MNMVYHFIETIYCRLLSSRSSKFVPGGFIFHDAFLVQKRPVFCILKSSLTQILSGLNLSIQSTPVVADTPETAIWCPY